MVSNKFHELNEFLSLDSIRQSIDDHVPDRRIPGKNGRQAAVAAILRPTRDHIQALFILRAIKEGDPWSGHMAFPGGHKDETDESLRHTAERETLEEIGLDLVQHGSYLGELNSVVANPRGRDMVVTPFLYELKTHDAPLAPNEEVADVLWGSLNEMMNGSTAMTKQFSVVGQQQEFPGFGVEGEIVWGLTYRVLEHLFALLDPKWAKG
jgi:8-oxo-dGTP pyrophosphatase MutT (NUDIX family)